MSPIHIGTLSWGQTVPTAPIQVCGNPIGSDVTSNTVTMTTAPSNGQLIVAFLGWGHHTSGQPAMSALNSPTGFSSIGSSGLGTIYAQCEVQTKTAGASEPTSYTWTWTGATRSQFHVVTFPAGTRVDGSPTFNNSGSFQATAVWPVATTTAANSGEYWLSAIYNSAIALVTWHGVTDNGGATAPLVMNNLSGTTADPASFLGELAGLQLTSAGVVPNLPPGHQYEHTITTVGGGIGMVCSSSVLITN